MSANPRYEIRAPATRSAGAFESRRARRSIQEPRPGHAMRRSLGTSGDRRPSRPEEEKGGIFLLCKEPFLSLEGPPLDRRDVAGRLCHAGQRWSPEPGCACTQHPSIRTHPGTEGEADSERCRQASRRSDRGLPEAAGRNITDASQLAKRRNPAPAWGVGQISLCTIRKSGCVSHLGDVRMPAGAIGLRERDSTCGPQRPRTVCRPCSPRAFRMWLGSLAASVGIRGTPRNAARSWLPRVRV